MRLVPAVALLALSGCGGSLEPGEVAGNYRLTTIDAQALPVLIYATIECDERVTAGALTLSATGGFVLRYATELACAGNPDARGREREFAGIFSLSGRRVLFNGAEGSGQRVHFEGESRGSGFLVLLPDNVAELTRELELGFEPAIERD